MMLPISAEEKWKQASFKQSEREGAVYDPVQVTFTSWTKSLNPSRLQILLYQEHL